MRLSFFTSLGPPLTAFSAICLIDVFLASAAGALAGVSDSGLILIMVCQRVMTLLVPAVYAFAQRMTGGSVGVWPLPRVSAGAGRRSGPGLRAVLRAGRRRRAHGPRCDVAGRTALQSRTLRAVLAVGAGGRHRPAHDAHEDRHRRAGPAALPSAASRRGSRHRRSPQQRPSHFRRRPLGLRAYLRDLWRRLRREPRAL